MSGLMMKYFVLKPQRGDIYGEASLAAMETYASWVEMENPELAADLREWIAKISAPQEMNG